MAKENAGKFEKLLISDEKLQAKFREAMTAFTGDRKDEKAVFEAVIKPLAEESGLPFTYEEGKAHADENKELALAAGDAVAGGSAADQGGFMYCAEDIDSIHMNCG